MSSIIAQIIHRNLGYVKWETGKKVEELYATLIWSASLLLFFKKNFILFFCSVNVKNFIMRFDKIKMYGKPAAVYITERRDLRKQQLRKVEGLERCVKNSI